MNKQIDTNLRVILVGGSSNVGKSVAAEALAKRLGWRCVSTDSLAKHPGRPWPQNKKAVPDHVSEHYVSLKADELLESVVLHHRRMSPLVAEFIWAVVKNAGAEKVVLEGAALWPFITAGHHLKEVGAIWLTASPETIRSRIHQSSGYVNADPRSRAIISKFLERTLMFDRKTTQLVMEHGCKVLEADEYPGTQELVNDIVSNLRADLPAPTQPRR